MTHLFQWGELWCFKLKGDRAIVLYVHLHHGTKLTTWGGGVLGWINCPVSCTFTNQRTYITHCLLISQYSYQLHHYLVLSSCYDNYHGDDLEDRATTMYNMAPPSPKIVSRTYSHPILYYLLAKFLAFEVTLPLMASGLYSDPNSLRKSSYIGRDVSAFMALWKSGLLPFSTWHNVN